MNLPRTRSDSYELGFQHGHLTAETDLLVDIAPHVEQIYSEVRNEWLTEETRASMNHLLNLVRLK